MKMIFVGSLFFLITLTQGCASTVPRASGNGQVVGTIKASPGAAPEAKVLVRSQLPVGFAVGVAKSPFGLVVSVDGSRVTAAPATNISDATVTLEGVMSDAGTNAKVKNALDVMLKYDMYISPDGERFFYTSSCPLVPNGSAYEMWPEKIHSFAFGNLRVVSGDDMVCI